MKWTPRFAAGLALLAGTTYVVLIPAEAVAFANSTPITIPVLAPGVPAPWPGQPYPSNIAVSGLGGTVTDVNVTLNGFDCSAPGFPEDIDMLLVGPTGANVVVLSDIGGAVSSSQFADLTINLDDQAAAPLPADTRLAAGTYRPLDDDDDPSERVAIDRFPDPAPVPSAATALSVFKPWGMTRFGRRKRHEQKKISQPMPPSGGSPAITPWRLFVLLGVIGLLVLFVVLHLTGWVPHGH